jgi:glycosyltransferase involved in cell wall biosynthesis
MQKVANPIKISIVTPSYNQGNYIKKAIQSVLAQDYPHVEHIILDNCSTDQTLDVLKRYDHLTWRSEPDNGQSDALNRGFKMARGDIVGWLNADDQYLPGCFQSVIDFLSRHSEIDIV